MGGSGVLIMGFLLDHGIELLLAIYSAWRHVTTPARHARWSSRNEGGAWNASEYQSRGR